MRQTDFTDKNAAQEHEAQVSPEDSATLKENLFHAFLRHVPRKGWTNDALLAAAEEQKLPDTMVWALFPSKEKDALITWNRSLNKTMSKDLDTMDLSSMKVRSRIFWAVRTRLNLMAPHKEAARASWQFLLNKANTLLAARVVYEASHAMWSAAGDTSTDYNFYTKRLLLGGVYTTTFRFWLNDTSPDHLETARFLENRIADVLKLGQIKSWASLIRIPQTLMGLWNNCKF